MNTKKRKRAMNIIKKPKSIFRFPIKLRLSKLPKVIYFKSSEKQTPRIKH